MTNTILLGEFLGTMVFLAFGCAVVANVLLKKSKGEGSGCIVIYTGWAMGILMGVTVGTAVGNTADLSPAVTLFKLLGGFAGYTVSSALAMMGVQVLGGVAGATLAWLIYLPHFEVTEDKAAKLGIFCTGPAIRNYPANFLCEFLGTTILIVIIFSLGSKNIAPNGMAGGFGNYMVAMVVWAVGLCFGGPTGYALNPARDLGPRIAHAILPIAGKGGSDWAYSWIPVVAPLAGGIMGYVICKASGII